MIRGTGPSSIFIAGAATLVLGLASAAHAEAEEQALTFRFNPPNGLTYTETITTDKQIDMGGSQQNDGGTTTVRVSVAQKPDGYEIRTHPISMTMTRDGRRVDSPMIPALLQTDVTYRVDA